MRRPLLAVALLSGAAVVPLVGSMGACVIQPIELIDAGADATSIPPACDELGGQCKTCQACPAVQDFCSKEITACKKSDTCLALAKCNDQCDTLETDAGVSTCKTDCCNTAMKDPAGASAYGDVASCIYGGACPNTCVIQHQQDVCGGL
jgi:hypothetical protein